MNASREHLLSRLVLFAVLAANVMLLWPELTISRLDLNDNALHFPLVQGIVDAVEHGRNPLDWWAPEWTLGYPVLRTYQPLAHALVAAAYFALGKTVSLMTVFVWVRFLSVALLPLSFFVCARWLGFAPLTAAAAALLSPLISTNGLYGLEYGSYVWAGSGLFTQAVASNFLLLALGAAFRAIRYGRRIALAGMLLGLAFLAHFIYGYIAGLCVGLLALMPDSETPRLVRLRRAAWTGAVAALLIAFELLPLLSDGSLINRSRWEAAWKWDSFGADQVLKWLFTGELLDHGRLPVLSLLALAGLAIYLRDVRLGRRHWPARTFVVLGAALWVAMFFGRPFWGPLLSLTGALQGLQIHRVIGGAHVFLILLGGIGLAGLWRMMARRSHGVVAAILTLVVLYPAARERATYLANNSVWGHRSLAAYTANQDSVNAALSHARDRGGRAYAGLAATWGASFKVGDLPFYAYLSEAHVPAVGFLYHSMALTSDIMVRFNEANPFHYGLFNVHTVIAPTQPAPALPSFLTPAAQAGPIRVFDAPASGYFDVVDASYGVRITRETFYDVNDRWLQSDWLANRQYLMLALDRDISPGLNRLSIDDPLPPSRSLPSPGAIRSEQQQGEMYQADLDAGRPAFALFKMTWHPNWKAYVDGSPRTTIMLSPGFIGVQVQPGAHHILFRYEPEQWKAVVALFGFVFVPLLVLTEHGRLAWAQKLTRVFSRPDVERLRSVPRYVWMAAGLAAAALPVSLPLLTSQLPEGHDAFAHLPRVVEFHQNIANGILLPRWAPDLSSGAGQPLFLFYPPLFYYLAEGWHLLGFDFVRSINLACVALVISSAAGMFLLGRLYFGEAGGWLAAVAYLYAPYLSVDLYVRSALGELTAFPFFAFALYGFGAFAKTRNRKYMLLGAAAYAAVMTGHNPSALLFSPLLLAFAVFTAWSEKSWSILRWQAYGIVLGLGLGAFTWLPSLAERGNVRLSLLLQDGYLYYSNHFVYPHQLLDSPWGYGLSVPGDQDGMSFGVGWGQLIAVAAAIACALVASPRMRGRRRITPVVWFFGASAAVLCFLTLEQSRWIWDRLPLLQLVQFPWRFLAPASVCIAVLAGSLGAVACRPEWRIPGIAAATALLIVPNLSHLRPKQFHEVDLAFWTPQQIAERGAGVATLDEYRPRWMTNSPSFRQVHTRVISGDIAIQELGSTPVSWSGLAHAANTSTVELFTAYFPGWELRIDGRPEHLNPNAAGLIEFQVPAGTHRVQVDWNRTASSWAGDALSVLSLGAAMLSLLGLNRGKTPFAETRNIRHDLTAERAPAVDTIV